jgi:hypothetical protein
VSRLPLIVERLAVMRVTSVGSKIVVTEQAIILEDDDGNEIPLIVRQRRTEDGTRTTARVLRAYDPAEEKVYPAKKRRVPSSDDAATEDQVAN